MKKIFTLLLSFVAVMAMAQAPTGVFKKATVAPEIDGVVDDVWATANVYNIDQNFASEKPTLGASGESTWQALWNEEGVYVLLKVKDDAWYPAYMVAGSNNWEYDKPEIYFDVNYVLEDGIGAGGGKGHIQVAPGAVDGKIDGTPTTDNQVIFSFMVDGGSYIAEYFVPYARLTDKDGNEVDKTNTIGFDVTLIDRDPGDASRKRAVWANIGGKNESYNNMDDAGHVTFEGAEAPTYVDEVKLNTGGVITTDNGTLQMVATITPEDASNKKLKWSIVNGTGMAAVDANGLVTAIKDGTVSVKATATDGSMAEAMVDIEISGQALSQKEVWTTLNLIRNWNTDENTTGWGGWVDGGVADQVAPKVEDGVVVMKAGLATDGAAWHYQHNQNALNAEANVPYVLRFKSWASADNVPAVVDFEDTSGNGYNRYGASTSEGNVNGRSEWNYTLNVEPAWYTFVVTFDQMVANTDQKLQYMLSLSNETIYLDSVLLVKEEIWTQYPSLPSAIAAQPNNINNVYPNPVENTLYVDLANINSKVAIFNSVGQKLMEKNATGSRVTFDVRSLRRGMYFVKLEDGSTKKFIK